MRALIHQLRRYASFARWFVGDAFLRYRWRVGTLLAANVTGVAAQALALLIAYQYAAAVEAGSTIRLAGFALEPRTSMGLLAASAAAVLLLGVGSALLVMRYRVGAAELALDYAEHCSRRVYCLLSRLPASPGNGTLPARTHERLAELAHRDAASCGLVFRIVLYALEPTGTALVAALALFALDPYLTLLVLPILVVAALFLRRTSIRGALHRAQLLRHRSDLSRSRRALGERLTRTPAALSAADAFLREVLNEGSAAQVRRAVLGQRQALEGGKLIAQVAIACALFLVLLVQGSATLAQAGNWSALLAYIVALSFFGASMARLGGTLVSINRFYPPLAGHARFVQQAELELAEPLAQEAGSYALSAPMLGEQGGPPLEMRPGDRVAIVLPDTVSRYSMAMLAGALRARRAEGDASRIALPWFACAGPGIPGGSLREHLGLSPACSMQELQDALAALPPLPAPACLPPALDRRLTDAERRALSGPALFVLTVLAGLRNRCSAIALEHEALVALSPELRQALLQEACARAIVLVAYRVRNAQPGYHGESAVIIAGREQVLGWAPIDVFAARDSAVLQALAKAAEPASGPRTESIEELDEMA